MSFAALLLIILSGGTALAAKGALPGDVLYPIKINVNERVETAMATTPVAKAQVNAAFATARLEEAEALASNGKLDATTTAALASNFKMHAAAAQINTTQLESNDPATAAQLGAEFDSTLAAHGAILAQIGDDSSNTETMQSSNSLAERVRESQQEDGALAIATPADVSPQPAPVVAPEPQNGARIRTFAAKAPTSAQPTLTAASASPTSTNTNATSTHLPKAAAGIHAPTNPKDAQIAASLGTQASSSLTASIRDFASLASLSASTSAQISAQIASAHALYATAQAALQSGDAAGAKTGFARVLRMSVTLDAYLKAGKRFNLKILNGLLNSSENKTDSSSTSDKSGKDSGPAPSVLGTTTVSAGASSSVSEPAPQTIDTKKENKDQEGGDSEESGSTTLRLRL